MRRYCVKCKQYKETSHRFSCKCDDCKKENKEASFKSKLFKNE